MSVTLNPEELAEITGLLADIEYNLGKSAKGNRIYIFSLIDDAVGYATRAKELLEEAVERRQLEA